MAANAREQSNLATPHTSRLQSLEAGIWQHISHNPVSSMWDLRGLSLREVAARTWAGVNEDNLFGRASQLAYAFFAAIFPGLIAISSMMGLVAQSFSDIYVKLLDRIGRLLPPSAFQVVIDTFQQTTRASTGGKVVLGILFALFSASVGISAIQDTLNTVYKVKETRPFWKARLEAIGLTVLVAFIVLSALFILFAGDFSANYSSGHLPAGLFLAVCIRIVAWTLACLLMILSFEVMYFFCPDVKRRRWRGFTPGGVLGLAGWVAGSVALRIYLHYFNSYSVTYGSLGAVIILLLWFYITGVMILLGGEVNSEIEHAVAKRDLAAAVPVSAGEIAPAA